MTSENSKDTQEPKEAIQIKCESCGGAMVYAPRVRKLECIYCGLTKELSLQPATIHENDYLKWLNESEDEHQNTEREHSVETQQIKCEQCGATVTVDETKSSTKCPYCGTPLILEQKQVRRFWKPEYLLPFAVDKKDCGTIFNKWLDGKWFLSSKYKHGNVLANNFQGVYYPYWTYDASTRTSYSGMKAVDTHVVRKGPDGKTYTTTQRNWYPVSGVIRRDFDDILVPASNNLNTSILAGLGNWQLRQLVTYSPEFTAGFTTDIYTVSFKEGAQVAQRIMDNVIERDIRNDIGGNAQKITGKHTSYNNVMFKHILLPLWVGAFKIEDKTFQFVINGYSGKVYGEYPKDKLKIALVVIAVIIILYLLFNILSNG